MGKRAPEQWNRRKLLIGGGMLVASTALPHRLYALGAPRFRFDPFSLGVASGYPTSDSVVLWTRLAPEPLRPDGGIEANQVIPVQCEIATDERMRTLVRRDTQYAIGQFAHSIHYEPSGLDPDRAYWFRFTAGGERSVIGRTRTAPALNYANEHLRIAVASCQHYEHGYFNAYRHMVRDDLDLVVHVGDYIYESSWGEKPVRHHNSPEAITLEDYRIRHALYRSDPHLQAAHALCPWLVTWDDHEVENDYAGETSQHDDPRDWFLARRAAAYRAYYEHMPLPRRATPFGANLRLFAQRSFGRLANVMMLDTRQYRSPLACTQPYLRGSRAVNCSELIAPERTKLGAIQERWLDQQLARSRSQWNLLAQGTVMTRIDEGDGNDSRYWSDNWNGYPAARERLMSALVESRVQNPVVLSGDIHAFLVANLHRAPLDLDSPVIASELVTSSITSQGGAQQSYDRLKARNPNMLLADSQKRGYLRLDITRERLRAELVAMDSVSDADAAARILAAFVIERDKPGPVRETING